MWILSVLPEFIPHLIFIIGVLGTIAGFVLGFIPFISTYKLPIQIISILILSLGLYLEGGLANEANWKLKVKEMEAKVAQAEIKSEKVTTEVVTKVIVKKQIIKQTGDTIVKYIDRETVKMDQSCPVLPDIVVNVHNAAAKNDATLLNFVTEIPVQSHNELVNPSTMKLPKK